MTDDAIDALVAAADDGVARDGLRVERAAAGYDVAVAGDRRDGLSEPELRAFLADHPASVSNWRYWSSLEVPHEAEYAFLRWVERADERGVPARYDALARGTAREWGDLLVTARLGEDGDRRYALRHVDDRGVDAAALERHDDPLDARDLATFDSEGRYRPLKTAPSLRTGWVFPDLEPHELVDAVDFFYPATIANWHLEREGHLDVTDWRAAASRQSGIYDVVDELDPAAVAWAAAACCVDDACLKRREWDYDEGEELGVERGDGAFPCREPCSLLIAAAREWAHLEREETRTYELELTPGERDQLEAIVDAVADGRIDEIREAEFDDPANRYRARYLRAKRFRE